MSNSSPKTFPSKTSITPFWRSELDPLDEYRSTEKLPSSCDILIVGGGYAGIAAAYHLLCSEKYKDRKKPSVVLLEARQACSGATARNGGHLKPSVFNRLLPYIKRYGAETAAAVADLENKHVDAIRDVVEKEGIECDFKIVRGFTIYTERGQFEDAKTAYKKLKEMGLAKETIDDLIWADEDEAEKVSHWKNCAGCFSNRAATLWPYKLMMGLLNRAVSNGLNLQTNTAATTLVSSGSTWTATTPRGAISAPKVIIATNGYTSALLPEYTNKIVAARGIASRIVVPEGRRAPELPGSYGIIAPGAWDYISQRPDGSIIVGGARPTFFDADSEWKNVVDDSTLIEPAKHYFDKYMQEHFVGWEDSGAHVEDIWTGIMGYNSDGLPSFGAVPGREGVFIAAGFEGHGMPVIFLAMKGIVEMVAEGKTFEETGVPVIYKTTKERLESSENRLARK